MKATGYILLFFMGFILLIPGYACAQTLSINEIVSSNSQTVPSVDGNYYDWIELYNPTDSIIQLNNYSLSEYDNLDKKWTLPAYELGPERFFLIHASGLDTLIGHEAHANFKIKSAGESLVLRFRTGQVADFFEAVELKENESCGKLPDGTGPARVFTTPTPMVSNSLGIPRGEILFSLQPGLYENELSLEIRVNSGDSIYYSLDGSEPTPNARGTFLYRSPLSLKDRSGDPNGIFMIPTSSDHGLYKWKAPEGSVFKATIVRARSYRSKKASSDILTGSYFISKGMAGRYTMPLLSLVTPEKNLFDPEVGIYVPGNALDPLLGPYKSGNYLMEGENWERPVHMEFFDTGGRLEFAQNFGIRIQGGNSRVAPQKSLKVYARSEYGKSRLEYRLFPELEIYSYKRFLLQTCDLYYKKAIFNDDVIHELSKNVADGMASRPCILFINGAYWGIHRIREHMDKYYLASHHEVDQDELDLLKSSRSMVIEGSNTEYTELINFIKTNDLSDEISYQYVLDKINVQNFMDYVATEILFSNYDWPMGNIKYWKKQNSAGKWRWLLYDLDAGFRNPDYDMLKHATLTGGTLWPNPDHATILFRSLLQNRGFRSQFISRISYLMQNDYHSDRILNKLKEYRKLYEPELSEHFSRWPSSGGQKTWLKDLAKSEHFARSRSFYMKTHLQEFFGLDSMHFAEGAFPKACVVFPNPVRDLLIIEFADLNRNFHGLELYDIFGRQVRKLELEPDHRAYPVSVLELPEGMYLLRLVSDSEDLVERITVLD